MGDTSQSYYDFLNSAVQAGVSIDMRRDVDDLINTYSSSLEIYNCFKKNFSNPEGEYQQELMRTIEGWHISQSILGVNSLLETYKVYDNPAAIVSRLNDFRSAPAEIKDQIAEFYRSEIINNEVFIKTNERRKLRARVKALIGLKYFDYLTPEEQELFDKALEQGVIRNPAEGVFSGSSRPLP